MEIQHAIYAPAHAWVAAAPARKVCATTRTDHKLGWRHTGFSTHTRVRVSAEGA